MIDRHQTELSNAELAAGKALRDASLRAIGIDPDIIKWPSQDSEVAEPVAKTSSGQPLSDIEWREISDRLPAEPSQVGTMGNRAFVDAVLLAIARGSWTDHRNRGQQSDAVRRKFGRWAHQGVWQSLTLSAQEIPMSGERKAEFAKAASRAASLFRRT